MPGKQQISQLNDIEKIVAACMRFMQVGHHQEILVDFAHLSYKNFEEENRIISFAALAILFRTVIKN